jgi:hypothetical protein
MLPCEEWAPYPYCGVLLFELCRVDGSIFWKRESKALRSGGRDAMSMPIEASAEDHIWRLIPSHVGSWVFVMAFSSTVLKIEQIVAL